MLRHLSTNVFSALPAIALAIGLGGCEGSPPYVVERLEAIPVPAPVLMRQMPNPDCRVRPRLAVAAGTENPKNKDVGSDFENQSFGASNPDKSPAKNTTSRPANADITVIKKERDCYRRAEQVARRRLNELQASATGTVLALGGVKHHLNAQSLRPHWWLARVALRSAPGAPQLGHDPSSR